MRPPMPGFTLSRRAKGAIWVVVVLIVLFVIFVQLTGVFVNWKWYGSLGYTGVYATVFWTRLSLFFIFGCAMALILAGNLALAWLLRPPFRPMSAEQQNVERYRLFIEPRRRLLLAIVAAIALLSAGMSAQGQWSSWQLWLHGTSFGQRDPQFHLDISFFAWDYPVYRLLLGFGFTAVLLSLVLSAIVHYLVGGIRLQTPGPKVTLVARRHLTLLVFVFLILKAIAYWLDRYGLEFSERSKFTGASYTDVHSVLPARTILFWIALILAAAVLASLWLRGTLVPAIGFISMLVLSILISGIYPAVVQQVSVKPNASTKEAPYISRNIEATRDAYGIQTATGSYRADGANVVYKKFNASSTVSTALPYNDEGTGNATVNNIRVLDPNLLSTTFGKFQQFRNVYGFPLKLDMDRYTVDGQVNDYVVAVRELDAASLSGAQTNWINEHTNFTHGYGFVAAQGNKDVTNQGDKAGAFAAGYIPPSGDLVPTQPREYFGELLPNYSIVGAEGARQEFDGNGTPKYRYQGTGGVSLSNFFTRLAFAVHYKEGNFVLNNAASAKGARIIFDRDPRQMVQKVAPFLRIDSDPYPIIDTSTSSTDPSHGDIVWMVDGYTTIDDYPYAERQSLSALTSDTLSAENKTARQPNDQINYIRNSVKATVDAYTGKVTLYAWDPNDPVLQSWEHVFPGLVKPLKEMPSSIEAHVRYPQDLFKAQRALLGQYHVTNPVTFYNVSDKWTVPTDPTSTIGTNQPPYYVLASDPQAPSSTTPEFQLTSPMNVNEGTFLAAYLSVNSEPGPNYGKITVLKLPSGNNQLQGVEQIYNTFTTDPTIRKDSLLTGTSNSSKPLHGNLLTLPLGRSMLYVEPLYFESGTGNGSYPILQRVLLSYGGKLGYGANLPDALSDFAPGATVGHTLGLGGGSNSSSGPSSSAPPPSSAPPSSASSSSVPTPPRAGHGRVTVQQIDQAVVDLHDAYASGNAAKIGLAEQRLYELVQRYNGQRSSTPSSPAPPSPSSSGGQGSG